MSLTVEVTADGFTKLVQKALTTICGGEPVVVDPISGKVSAGAMTCAGYCDHPAGCNMLADLIAESIPFTILYSENSSGYDEDKIWWYPRVVDFSDVDTCGGTKIVPYVMLGHEMTHAREHSVNEDEAVRGENQIRMENCVPMRMEYSGAPVPDFRVGVLDASNRPQYGCMCSPLRGGPLKAFERLLCRLHSMYCIPRAQIFIRKLRGGNGGPHA